MSRLIISQASVASLPSLNRLLVRAVQKYFTYFPESVRNQVIKEHSVKNLLLAALDPRRVVLVARMDGEIVGYSIGAAPTTGPAQLFWLYVEPAHRGDNIGLSLLSRTLKLLAKRGADSVSIATHDHRRYYERQGFKFVRKSVVEGVNMDVMEFRMKS